MPAGVSTRCRTIAALEPRGDTMSRFAAVEEAFRFVEAHPSLLERICAMSQETAPTTTEKSEAPAEDGGKD